MFKVICKVFGFHPVDSFATRANAKLPVYVFLFQDSMVWEQDAFQHPWNDLSTFTLLKEVFSRDTFNKSLFDSDSSFMASEGLVCRCFGSSGGRTSQASLAMEYSGPALHQEVSQKSGGAATSCMEVVK